MVCLLTTVSSVPVDQRQPSLPISFLKAGISARCHVGTRDGNDCNVAFG